MAKKFNGILQYSALFVAVFLIALLFFAFVFSLLFPAKTLREGPVSPYFSLKTDSSEIDSSEDSILIGDDEYEFSKLISVYEKMSGQEKMELYTLFASKLSNSEIEALFEMATDGVDEKEREYFNSLATERLTAQDIGRLYTLYEKYA